MKKKLGIVAILLIILGVYGYTTVIEGATTVDLNKTWTLDGQQIKQLSFVGMEQDVHAVIEESNEDKTTVEINGKISEKAKNFLEKSLVSKDQLDVKFAEKNGVKLVMTSKGKDALTITIRLGKNVTVDEFTINMGIGNVKITVPETFDGTYKLTADSGGKVKAVPTTNKTMKSIVQIATMGDIEVTK